MYTLKLFETLFLNLACSNNALANGRTRFTGCCLREFGERNGGHLALYVYAVEDYIHQ